MKERDCANCKHHTSDGCSSWDCEFEKAMTREEAIAILEVSKHMATSGRLYNQALDMAIEALKEQPTIPMFKESEEAYKAWTGEEMGELIKREDAIRTMCRDCEGEPYPNCYCTDVKLFEEIPSADEQIQSMVEKRVAELVHLNHELEQQLANRPHGEWIDRDYRQVDEDAYETATCSNCKSEITIGSLTRLITLYEMRRNTAPARNKNKGGDTK